MRKSLLPTILAGTADPYPGVTVYDTFTDADSTALTAHTPNKAPAGAAWAHVAGAFQITSNRAAWVSNTGGYALAAIESGKADCVVSGIIKRTATGYCGIAFRVVDTQNYLIASIGGGQWSVIRRFQNNAAIVAQTAFSQGNNIDYAVQVTLSGTSIIAVIDGTTTVNTTYTNLTTATKHGLYAEVASNFDNFQVV